MFDCGIVIAKGRPKLWLRENLPDNSILTARMQRLVDDMVDELHAHDHRIKQLDQEFEALVKSDQRARLLRSVPGIGAFNATALAAAVGDVWAFAKGRDFAAWLGLVPAKSPTGGKPRLTGISKRGSTYMRVLLIHGVSGTAISGANGHPARRLAGATAQARQAQHGGRCACQ